MNNQRVLGMGARRAIGAMASLNTFAPIEAITSVSFIIPIKTNSIERANLLGTMGVIGAIRGMTFGKITTPLAPIAPIEASAIDCPAGTQPIWGML